MNLKKKLVFSMFFLLINLTVIFLVLEQKDNGMDKFGIRKIHNSTGREWFSKWDNGHARSWDSSSNDPFDSEFITQYKGSGSWKTDGNGVLQISGEGPRMYIIDPSQLRSWHNVEITVYGKRISDNGTEWAGIASYARTNHMIDNNSCDTRGYGGRFRYDGAIDFEKEISHEKAYAQTEGKNYWESGMPKNIWIGYKFIVYDLPNNSVKLELWIDTTDGLNGGNWTKINEFIDDGTNFGSEESCKSNVSSYTVLSNADNRIGSESGKPNLAVYFRSDNVNTDGLFYKKASIREIAGG
jgi:hypothetical protein